MNQITPYKFDMIQGLIDHKIRPVKYFLIEMEELYNYQVGIYQELLDNPTKRYLLTIQSANGYQSCVMRNMMNSMLGMELRAENLPADVLFKIIDRFIELYNIDCTIVINDENDLYIVKLFRDSKYRDQLYYTNAVDQSINSLDSMDYYLIKPEDYPKMSKMVQMKYSPMNTLNHLLKFHSKYISTTSMIEDLQNLVVDRKHSVRAKQGARSDNLMANIIGFQTAQILLNYNNFDSTEYPAQTSLRLK